MPRRTADFAMSLRPLRSTEAAARLQRARRRCRTADGDAARDAARRRSNAARARLAALPLQVQRLTQNAWRPVARTTGSFKRSLKPGSYRVKVLGAVGYSPAVSRPVGVH